MNPVPRIDDYFFKIYPNFSSQLCVGLPRGIFPVDLLLKIFKELLLSSILAICPARLNLIDLMTLAILDEWYEL